MLEAEGVDALFNVVIQIWPTGRKEGIKEGRNKINNNKKQEPK